MNYKYVLEICLKSGFIREANVSEKDYNDMQEMLLALDDNVKCNDFVHIDHHLIRVSDIACITVTYTREENS